VLTAASILGWRERPPSVTASDLNGDPGLGKDADVLAAWAERTAPRSAQRCQAGLRFAFYGRVSTEDWQDPVTSRARQRDQAAALVAGHGKIVAEFFDSGHSRTLTWASRPQAAGMVTALAGRCSSTSAHGAAGGWPRRTSRAAFPRFRTATSLGIVGLSKSQVSAMAAELDELVDSFRNRKLDGGPYTARGLSGVALVTSDDRAGLVSAIAAVLPGVAWQWCRTHYHRNLLTRVPKTAQPWVSTLVRTIFEQPDPASVRAQHRHVVDALEAKLPQAAAHLDEAREDILAFTAFPREVWRQIWSSNPQERLNKEIRRRTDVVGIFPGRDAIIRLVGAVLAEQNDEWTESRRYMGLEIIEAIPA